MKTNKSLILLSLSLLMVITSCGKKGDSENDSTNYVDQNTIVSNESSEESIAPTTSANVGEEISWEDAKALLNKLNDQYKEKYDLDDEIPEDLAYFYIEIEASGIDGGKNIKQVGFMYYSMKEDDRFSITNSSSETDGVKSNEATYIIYNGDDTYTSWTVTNGEVKKVDTSGLAGLGLGLGYAMFLATTIPEYTIEQIEKEGATPVSFIKYSDTNFVCTFEITPGEGEESDYSKEIVTIEYDGIFATSYHVEGYDKEEKIILNQTMHYSFEKKDYTKPVAPVVSAE